MKTTIEFTFEKLSSIDELNQTEQDLVKQAQKATKLAYAPYSQFNVGAAGLLDSNEIVLGSNQENASYGATVCAERTLLANVANNHPQAKIKTIAISYKNDNGSSDRPLSPCGICRQSLLEYENSHNTKLRIILSGQSGEIWVLDSSDCLLPLAFSSESLS